MLCDVGVATKNPQVRDVCMYGHLHRYVHTCMYMYREREREREKSKNEEREDSEQ